MVVNPGRSQWDPGGAERSGALPGRDGAAQLSFLVGSQQVPGGPSGAGPGLPSRVRTEILFSWVLKAIFEISLILVRVKLVFYL
ncbi:unnamed protein product [Trifolium pratense]|uniref:Uncharacterized protein n=1 Tax=Trifolium pratense TaxID=57577 RepID=A0ACB0LR44_TRIPR|nr:unnamed protein product [Trifolium pratense]